MHDQYPTEGRIEWIGLTPTKGAPLDVVQTAVARIGTGLDGDRHCAQGRPTSKRQVTLIQQEHFDTIGALLGRPVTPGECRRNVVVSGINLFSLRYARFRLGTALLEGTGGCAPCQRMEQGLGPGGYNAMRGHGGICARVIEPGEFSVGDPLVFVSADPPKGQE